MKDESRPRTAPAFALEGEARNSTDRRRPALTGVALRRLTISPEASRTIDAWAWEIAAGDLHLAELPAALFTFYTVAAEHGRQSRDEEVRQLRADADRLWLRSFGDEDRVAYLLGRLDRAGELANRPDVDDVLAETWRIYCAGLESIREPLTLPSPGRKVA